MSTKGCDDSKCKVEDEMTQGVIDPWQFIFHFHWGHVFSKAEKQIIFCKYMFVTFKDMKRQFQSIVP